MQDALLSFVQKRQVSLCTVDTLWGEHLTEWLFYVNTMLTLSNPGVTECEQGYVNWRQT